MQLYFLHPICIDYDSMMSLTNTNHNLKMADISCGYKTISPYGKPWVDHLKPCILITGPNLSIIRVNLSKSVFAQLGTT